MTLVDRTRQVADPEFRREFDERGFVGPLRVLHRRECRRVLRLLRNTPAPLDWFKGLAATSRLLYELGTLEEMLDAVTALLGPDVMLWGVSVLRRRPGAVHPWHTDLETAGDTGRTASAWIGLQHTTQRTSLMFIPHSHRFGASVQRVAFEAGKKRTDATTSDVVEWARKHDARCCVEQPAMGNGEAVIFDGRIWHGSRNTNRWGARTALLLQYATPNTPIRIPDVEANYEWPFQFLDHPKAPCIMVRGIDRFAQNRIVPAPSANPVLRRAALDADAIWPSWTKRLGDLNLSENEATGWNYHPVFKGSTAFMAQLTVHVSKLSLGAEPHPPHEHAEEELIVMLSGETEIVKVDDTPEQSTTVQRIGNGSFVYHSAYQRHTIRAVGSGPATYVIFKWLGKGADREEPWMQSSIFNVQDRDAMASEAIAMKRVFASRTRYLDRLHSHVTTLQPVAGYSPHRDPYDVAIVVLSGIVKTLGRRVGPHGVIFYAAGESHGMQNVGDTPANYLVFEFHGIDVRRRLPQLRGATAQLWRNRVRRINRRLRRAARRIVSAATSISLRTTTG